MAATATMTGEEVARDFLRHPEPASRAAAEMLRRYRLQGLPCVTTRHGGLYFRDQVEAWFRELAEQPARRGVGAPTRSRGRPRRRLPDGELAAAIRELEAEVRG